MRNLGCFVFVVVLAFAIWFINMLLTSSHQTDLEKRRVFDTARIGDSVFAKKESIADTLFGGVNIYELYRPEEAADIDKMDKPAWKKKQLKDQIPAGRVKSAHEVYKLKANEIYRRNSAFIGIVTGKDSSGLVGTARNHLSLEIRPFKNVYNKDKYVDIQGDLYPIKKFYVSSYEVALSDFLKK